MTTVTETNMMLSFIRRAFGFQDGALFVLAFPGAAGLPGLLELLLEETSLKALVLPLLVAGVGLSLYFVVFVLDFISGVRASRFEASGKPDYFKSKKGWNSIWKISVVAVLVIWSNLFSMVASLAGLPYFPNFFMFISAAVAIMATLLDIHSIGENQMRLSGRKSRFFVWLEQVTMVIREGFTARLKRFFKI